MFTGIIEGLGVIREIKTSGKGGVFSIEAGFELDRTKIGDSVSVSGACLTVVRIAGKVFTVDVSPETLSKTTFGKARIGDRVNLERALRFSDRLDGHLVSGHIDGTGRIIGQKTESNAILISFGVPESVARYMIEKGSVAVDGISLTINACDKKGFEIAVIPHTAKLTTIGFKQTGDAVNIETDMIGKWVERFVSEGRGSGEKAERSAIDMDFLSKTGFI